MRIKILIILLAGILFSTILTSLLKQIYEIRYFKNKLLKEKELIEIEIAERLNTYDQILLMVEKDLNSIAKTAIINIEREIVDGVKIKKKYSSVDLKNISKKHNVDHIYIINNNGIVTDSSLEVDINFNLFSLGKRFEEYLLSIFGKGELFYQRITRSQNLGTLNLYQYYSPKGSNFIIEVSIDVKEYLSNNYPEFLKGSFFEEYIEKIIKQKDFVVEVDVYIIEGASGWSFFTDGRKLELNEEYLKQLKKDKKITFTQNGLISQYSYIKRKTNSEFSDKFFLMIKYNLNPISSFVKRIIFASIVICILIIVIVSIIMVVLINKLFIDRIILINRELQLISNGDYSNDIEIKGNDEISQIKENIKIMKDEIIKRESDLRSSISEKELILKEVHHRVKNNMQLITSLLALQKGKINDEGFKMILDECRNRIKAMTMVHEKLYQAKDLSGINFKEYINEYIRHQKSRFSTGRIMVTNNVDDIILMIDEAIPFALLINEIITNSFKHAFPDNCQGNINITFNKNNNNYRLVIEDNGIGMSSNINFDRPDTLGLGLIHTLVIQLNGEVKFFDNNPGVRVEIDFCLDS